MVLSDAVTWKNSSIAGSFQLGGQNLVPQCFRERFPVQDLKLRTIYQELSTNHAETLRCETDQPVPHTALPWPVSAGSRDLPVQSPPELFCQPTWKNSLGKRRCACSCSATCSGSPNVPFQSSGVRRDLDQSTYGADGAGPCDRVLGATTR